MKMKQWIWGSFILVAGSWLVSCDQIEPDMLPSGQLETAAIVALAGEPVILDLLDGVNITEPIEVRLETAPQVGDLTLMAETLASYELPTRTTQMGDEFSMTITTPSETYTRTYQVEVAANRNQYPFGEQGAVYDRGGILQPGDSLVADVLANDAPGGTNLTIELGPEFGTASVTPDNQIAYTADSTYEGLVDVIYRAEYDSGRVGRALVRFAISE